MIHSSLPPKSIDNYPLSRDENTPQQQTAKKEWTKSKKKKKKQQQSNKRKQTLKTEECT